MNNKKFILLSTMIVLLPLINVNATNINKKNLCINQKIEKNNKNIKKKEIKGILKKTNHNREKNKDKNIKIKFDIKKEKFEKNPNKKIKNLKIINNEDLENILKNLKKEKKITEYLIERYKKLNEKNQKSKANKNTNIFIINNTKNIIEKLKKNDNFLKEKIEIIERKIKNIEKKTIKTNENKPNNKNESFFYINFKNKDVFNNKCYFKLKHYKIYKQNDNNKKILNSKNINFINLEAKFPNLKKDFFKFKRKIFNQKML